MATGDERPAGPAGAREDREPPASGWRQWGAKFARLDGDRCGGGGRRRRGRPAGEEGDEVKAALPAADPVVVDDGWLRFPQLHPSDPAAVPTGPGCRRRHEHRCGADGAAFTACPSRRPPRSLQAMWIDPPRSIATSARDGVGRSAPPHRAPRQMVPVPCPRSHRALRRMQPALRRQTQSARCKASPSSVAKRTWPHRRRRRLLGR